VKKTKCKKVSRKHYSENEYVKLGTYNFAVAEDCTYLGTVRTNKNKLRPVIERRIKNAN
jgi:hypothetical protein